ncbi:MAG: PhoH family protein, partial [Gammaproteobacteria bacterium]|nr:PhoH family protein [Gammaproteobacteria bacterium]
MSATPTPVQPQSVEFRLEPLDNARLSNLCGPFNQHLKQIEDRLGVQVHNRSNTFTIEGEATRVTAGQRLIEKLYAETESETLSPNKIHLHLQRAQIDAPADAGTSEIVIRTRRVTIKGRGPNQQRYLKAIGEHDISFGIGPAGTGKTYLAVAAAVEALDAEQVRRLVLVRPAVEAGERLGFLPGDLAQKVDPYLRPLYDALYEMCGFERVMKLIERNVIEVAPLAYMRGRTLNEAFIILDEAQNTTVEQMKMLLTRIGFGSTAVITGDVTQIDLPRGQRSGLLHVIKVLERVHEISFTHFNSRDVVRH